MLEQVYPGEVGAYLDAAYRRRAALNLDLLSIACAPYTEQSNRQRLHRFWSDVVRPSKPESEKPFDPRQLLGKAVPGMGVSPELLRQIQGTAPGPPERKPT